MRQYRSLAGTWEFQLDPHGSLTTETLAPDREIAVPLPWQAAFPELEPYSGFAWYRRSVALSESELAGAVVLHFGAVDYWCQVFVNGQLAAEHEGGYTPFDISIREHVRAGENELAVRVYDMAQSQLSIPRWPNRLPADTQPGPPFAANDVPHGKQEWYINIGGIWQDVTLLCAPATFLDLLHVTPDIHTGSARVDVTIAGAPAEQGGAIQLTLRDGETLVAEATIPLEADQTAYQATLTVASPTLWSLETPHLYQVTATLTASGDTLGARFGFREVATRDGAITLNGEPIYLLAALDQDLYPDGIALAPSEEYLRDQFAKAKHLGLNCLRCHIKPPEPRYLELADEMGLLVWAEIPSWRTFTVKQTIHPNILHLGDDVHARVENTLAAMIRRDYNHPALIIWTLVNEDWGTALALSPADRAWVASLYERCKQLDPTRLVVDNSACLNSWGPNVHVRTDLDDFHFYANIPDGAATWERFIGQFALRPAWSFSQHGDIERSGTEPLILSEFGNWGLPSLEGLRAHYGGDPPWFEIGPWWSRWEGEPGWARGVPERFEQLGLGAIWPSYEAFAEATQWHQFNAMKFEIETMRLQPTITGYVITELTDIYWESNGLMDFLRQPKVFHDVFGHVNAPDVVVATPERYSTWADEPLAVALHAAHHSPHDWSATRLRWQLGDSQGERDLPPIPRGAVAALGVEQWAPPAATASETVRLQLSVQSAAGSPLAQNTLDLLVLPAAERAPRFRAPLAALGTQDLAEAVTLGGYEIAGTLGDATLAITDVPDAATLAWVRDGGSLLFVCKSFSPFFWAAGRGEAYSGGWITSWSWLRPQAHRRLSVASPLGLPFRHIMPNRTILGVPLENPAYQNDVLAGMVAGWVRHPTAHTVQFRYGQGRVVMTTFALEKYVGKDAVATAMLHDLVEHLASDACQPTLALD